MTTQFYIEESEVSFSKENVDKYYLMRVFDYDIDTENANFFTKKGNIEKIFY
ncbi:hypothetical protein [Bacillus wiedmannii]|uniref:hypothetical protein n=1 Tax=Bacillus wiedmannii TaxID=1890302 RepID=UPI003709ADD3